VEARRQPGGQTGFRAREVDPRDPDLGESGLVRPLPQPLPQRLPVVPMLIAHAPILETRSYHWPDEAACADFATTLARRPALGDAYVELYGPLGAGKTTLVRHVLRALGVQGRIKSPTYAVVEPYALPGLVISHFDFYRFEDPREWVDAGLRDLFAQPGLKLAEWPERAAAVLPRPDLRLTLEPGEGDERRVTAQALSERGRALLP
jgi:tRNA threonylcarbamoyladenosine biosynthesis protein TsaE